MVIQPLPQTLSRLSHILNTTLSTCDQINYVLCTTIHAEAGANYVISLMSNITKKSTTFMHMLTSLTTFRTTNIHNTITHGLLMISTTSLPTEEGFEDAASWLQTGTHKLVGPAFKGPRPWSTTLVCWAGSCPLLNDAIIAVCKRKTVRKEKITERVGEDASSC